MASCTTSAAIQETLFLLSVSGMRESIREGMTPPVEEGAEDLDLVRWKIVFTELGRYTWHRPL